MIDLETVTAELESARQARHKAEAASADIEELMEDLQRAALRRQALCHAHPLWVAPALRLAS